MVFARFFEAIEEIEPLAAPPIESGHGAFAEDQPADHEVLSIADNLNSSRSSVSFSGNDANATSKYVFL